MVIDERVRQVVTGVIAVEIVVVGGVKPVQIIDEQVLPVVQLEQEA